MESGGNPLVPSERRALRCAALVPDVEVGLIKVIIFRSLSPLNVQVRSPTRHIPGCPTRAHAGGGPRSSVMKSRLKSNKSPVHLYHVQVKSPVSRPTVTETTETT